MSTTRAYLALHFCVFLWGFTAILGRLIDLEAYQLVWWRMSLAALSLLVLSRVRKRLRALPRRQLLSAMAVGTLITLHWLTFYTTVKLASASLAVLCMTLSPIAAALLAPRVLGLPFNWRDLGLATLVLPGMLLVVGHLDQAAWLAFLIGAISAVLVALFSIFNKRLVSEMDALTLLAIELGTGAALLSLGLPFLGLEGLMPPQLKDWAWLMVFAFACTTIPFVLATMVLRQLTPFAAQFAVNLEPVYALVLAAWFLGEARALDVMFYVGALIVLGAVLVDPIIRYRRSADPVTPARLGD